MSEFSDKSLSTQDSQAKTPSSKGLEFETCSFSEEDIECDEVLPLTSKTERKQLKLTIDVNGFCSQSDASSAKPKRMESFQVKSSYRPTSF